MVVIFLIGVDVKVFYEVFKRQNMTVMLELILGNIILNDINIFVNTSIINK